MSGNSEYKPEVGWTATEGTISVYFFLFLSLLALTFVLCNKLHHSSISSFFPEAGLIIIVGVCAGGFFSLFPGGSSSGTDTENYSDYGDQDDDEKEHVVVKGLLSFSAKAFFVALLPPIIFNSGYHIKNELFARHIVPILLYACVGTVVSTFAIAFILKLAVDLNMTNGFEPSLAELLTFGALISATDPVSTLAIFQTKKVDPQLFYLVFGESVMNDAVGLVLFSTFAKFVGHEENVTRIAFASFVFGIDFLYIFGGSCALGIFTGAASAYLFKVIDMKETTILELSLYVLLIYFPFFAAESLRLSGIVTILFTGITAKRYAEPNLSEQTQQSADSLFRVLAHLAESAIFLELGLSLFGIPRGITHLTFILVAFLACLIGRALNIYPISFAINKKLIQPNRLEQRGEDNDNTFGASLPNIISLSNDLQVSAKTSHMLWYSGLRGAVAYACAKSFPDDLGHQSNFVATTMWIILITIFLFGSTTDAVLKKLHIDVDVDEDQYFEERRKIRSNGILSKLGEYFSTQRFLILKSFKTYLLFIS